METHEQKARQSKFLATEIDFVSAGYAAKVRR
jgi:hypothetical protein